MNVGSGATLIFNKAKATEALEVPKIKQSVRSFSFKLIEKFRKRSPLRYQLCLYISSLSPTQIATGNIEFLTNLFNKLCLSLVDKVWISSTCADRAEVYYGQFVKSGDVVKEMKDFTMDTRLDVFYMEVL